MAIYFVDASAPRHVPSVLPARHAASEEHPRPLAAHGWSLWLPMVRVARVYIPVMQGTEVGCPVINSLHDCLQLVPPRNDSRVSASPSRPACELHHSLEYNFPTHLACRVPDTTGAPPTTRPTTPLSRSRYPVVSSLGLPCKSRPPQGLGHAPRQRASRKRAPRDESLGKDQAWVW